MWYFLDLNLVDDPFDLVLSIVWWILIAVVCAVIQSIENRRKQTIRTTFIAPGLIYNSETGVVELKSDEQYVLAIKKVLEKLDYGFDKKDPKNSTKIRFKYIVHTSKFSDNGKVWEGDVVKVTNPSERIKFSNESGLIKLLENANAA